MKLERYKDKKETRKKVVLISLTVVTIVSVAMMLYKTFAKFTTSTSFTIMSGKVKYKPKGKDLTEIPTVSQGDGLYSVSHSGASGDWSKSELRYAGSNPNNYVYFNCNNGEEEDSTNCELWRIIGLVNVKTNENTFEQRLKIIRKDLIGSYTFDYHGPGNYSSDWTRATLMGLLNSTYYNSLNANTYCYRGSYQSTCDFSATGSQKGLTSKAKGMIDSTVIWPLGGWKTSEVTAEVMYGYERGTTTYGSNPTEWNISNTKDPANDKARTDLFRGVGLMYPSDYGYAVGGGVRTACLKKTLGTYSSGNCAVNDWLYLNGIFQWSISTDSSSSDGGLPVNGAGFVDDFDNWIPAGMGVRPVVFLNSRIKIEEGEGTRQRPYSLVS